MSEFTLAQFKQLHELKSHSTLCYPNRTQNGHVSTKTITKQINDRQNSVDQAIFSNHSSQPHTLLLSGGKWTLHDLRRT